MTTTSRRPARERILQTAARLFYAHGIRGVGVDRIIAESGVAKATLYSHFPSKDALVLAYLRQEDVAWQGQLRAAAEAAGDDPGERLVGMFDAVSVSCTVDDFRGCAFLNGACESESESVVHRATAEHKRAVRAWVCELARAAGAADPERLAVQLTLLVDGAMAASTIEYSPEAGIAAKEAARVLVAAACRK
ncbi:TetR/AcrR family transcriptional regulator [Streptomyces capparidis]